MGDTLRLPPMLTIGRVTFAKYRRWQLFWPRRCRDNPPGYPYSWLMMFGPIEIRIHRKPERDSKPFLVDREGVVYKPSKRVILRAKQ